MTLFEIEGVEGEGEGESAELPDLERLVPGYRAFLESRSLASTTRRDRLRGVRRFLAFLKDRGREHARDIRLMDLEEFRIQVQRECRDRACRGQPSPGLVTANTSTRAAVLFCRWLVSQEVLLLDPSQDLAPTRIPTRTPVVLSHAQVEALLMSVSGDTPHALRDRAILEVFYASALRSGELLHLDVADLDLHEKEVVVRHGKGGVARRAPLGDWAVDAVARYLARGRPAFLRAACARTSDPEALWLSGGGRRMSRAALQVLVPRRAHQAGVAVRVCPHTLRHTAAVHLLQGGASVRHVQEFLGHRSAQTTVRYTTLTLEDLKDAWDACHPRLLLEEALRDRDA